MNHKLSTPLEGQEEFRDFRQYCVAPDNCVRSLRTSVKTRTLQLLEDEFGVVSADELTEAVSTCSSEERTYDSEEG